MPSSRVVCDDCMHPMLVRCPECRREQYGPDVWEFSHGKGDCACGFRATLPLAEEVS